MEEEKIYCVWETGKSCDGNIEVVKLFNKELKMPICEGHLRLHKKVLKLVDHGWEIEKIIDLSVDEMIRECNIMKLTGIKSNKDSV